MTYMSVYINALYPNFKMLHELILHMCRIYIHATFQLKLLLLCRAHLELLHIYMPLALLVSCLSSSTTCCSRLTNCHGTVPSTPVTDVSAGWLLMKIGWKTSIGLSPGGVPWFIMPAFVPEATGSTLSARTDPSKFWGLSHAMSWGFLI